MRPIKDSLCVTLRISCIGWQRGSLKDVLLKHSPSPASEKKNRKAFQGHPGITMQTIYPPLKEAKHTHVGRDLMLDFVSP